MQKINRKIITVILCVVFLVACKDLTATMVCNENIVFEYREKITVNEENIAKIIKQDQSTYDSIESIDVDTDTVGSDFKGTLMVSYKNKETIFEFNYTVEDTQFPILTGVENITVKQGETPNFQKMTAQDVVDGRLDVTIEGNYAIDIPGTYQLTAKAVDKNNNETKQTFNLIVQPRQEKPKTQQHQGNKYIVTNPESTLVLVNKQRYLPSDYTPPLQSFPQGYAVNAQQKARPEVVDAYVKMQNQLKSETGLTMYVTSSYRTFDYQQKLFERYAQKDGVKAAERYSARPGTSEHHTGLALDLETVSGNMTRFGETPQGQWVAENCYKFGFIIRYKKEWEPITGYMAEPWHIRYLGVEEATRVFHANQPYELLYSND